MGEIPQPIYAVRSNITRIEILLFRSDLKGPRALKFRGARVPGLFISQVYYQGANIDRDMQH